MAQETMMTKRKNRLFTKYIKKIHIALKAGPRY